VHRGVLLSRSSDMGRPSKNKKGSGFGWFAPDAFGRQTKETGPRLWQKICVECVKISPRMGRHGGGKSMWGVPVNFMRTGVVEVRVGTKMTREREGESFRTCGGHAVRKREYTT